VFFGVRELEFVVDKVMVVFAFGERVEQKKVSCRTSELIKVIWRGGGARILINRTKI